MKGRITTIGFILTFILLITPVYPSSLQFDLDGNPSTLETELRFSYIGEVVEIDVWLTDYDSPVDLYMVGFNFFITGTTALHAGCTPYINLPPVFYGPWETECSFCSESDGGDYVVKSDCGPFPWDGHTVVDNKVKLQTILLLCSDGGEGAIRTENAEYFDVDFGIGNPDNPLMPIIGPCKITIDPADPAEVFPGDTIQFTATEKGDCVASPNYNWELEVNECGSTITPGGLYTAGINCPCTDEVTVTDSTNTDAIVNPVSVNVKCRIEPSNPTIGAGERIVFQGFIGECDKPVYTWSVESSIGSTISEGNSVNSKGYYRAGREFADGICEEATDVITLYAACLNDKGWIVTDGEAETTVVIPPCVVKISPQDVEIGTGETILLSASHNGCCEFIDCDPEYPNNYIWEIKDGKGNSTETSGLTYTWSESAVGTTVNLTDTCNSVSDTVNVVVTTTTSIPPQCTSDAFCFDGDFCNGIERCVDGLCQPGSNPCPDDGLFCNGAESCDEDEDTCTQSGDPCIGTEKPICNEEIDACVECLSDEDCEGDLVCSDEGTCVESSSCETDADCDDGLFCNGVEVCVDGVCQDGELVACEDDGEFCNGVEVCDEDTDACISPGDPCIGTEAPVCDEANDMCVPKPLPIQISPDPVVQSRWIPLFKLLHIIGDDTTHFDTTSLVTFSPANTVLKLLSLTINEDTIWIAGILMPQFVTSPLDEGVFVTVTTGSEEANGSFTVNLLPLFLDEGRKVK